jgi:lipopolysaccharide export system permease protein
MKILYRYIIKEYIKILFICCASVMTIYLLAHFLGKLDSFIKYKASPSLVGILMALKIPNMFYEVLPIVVLLATLITLSLLSRSNEITALRSCGIGLKRVLIPLFVVTLLLASFSFIDGEWGIPYANQKFNYLDDVALKKRMHILALKKNRIWFHTGENSFCNIRKVEPKKQVLKIVTLYTFNENFNLVRRLDAKHVAWDGEQWKTRSGTEWLFTDSGTIREERAFSGPFPITIPLEEIINVEKSPKEMGYAELRDYTRILKKNGYPTTSYEVDLHAKISYSVISLIMILIGIPFSLQINRSGGMALSIGLSLGIGFLYWITYSVGISLGHAGFLHPILAAWLVNLLFGVAGFYWTARIRF